MEEVIPSLLLVITSAFQLLLTTKPTSEGMGLGLSLSYYIIQAHKGEMGLEPEQGRVCGV